MAYIDIPPGDGTEVTRVWQLVPKLKEGEDAFRKTIYEAISLPLSEAEVARMRIAQLNDCNF